MKYFELIYRLKTYSKINQDFIKGKPSHAYMLVGEDEELTKELARLVAANFICSSSPACGQCVACENVFKGTHTRIYEYPKGSETKINVAAVSEIIEQSYMKAIEGGSKVFILKNFSEMLPQSQNKLLKLLEEPPEGAKFILVSSSGSGVLPTIKSRVSLFELEKVETGHIVKFLTDKYGDTEKVRGMALLSGGRVSLAEKMLSGTEYYEMYEDMLLVMDGFDHSTKLLDRVRLMLKYEPKIDVALDFLELVLRDVMMYKVDEKLILNSEKIADIKNIAAIYPLAAVIAAVEKINEARVKLRFNCIKKTVVDNLLLSILEERRKCLLL